jgi:hypothetical protein
METRTTKRLLVAGLLAATLLVVPAGLSVTVGETGSGVGLVTTGSTAHAAPIGHPVEGPMRTTIAPGSTGNPALDDLCRQAADLINNAEREQLAAYARGDLQGGNQWGEHAGDMRRRAEGWGCQFVGVRQVPSGGSKQVPITGSSLQQISQPGSKPVPITNTVP